MDTKITPGETAASQAFFDTVYLDPQKIRFGYDGENLVFVDAAGTYYPRVTLRRCFPLSADNTYILVRVPEAETERTIELGIVANCDELNEESRTAVLRELRMHYFVPMLKKVNNIKEEFGFLYWDVDTDRGRKQFIMRDSIIGSTRRVSDGRWLLIDINQTRYEVHNLEDLDVKSQDLLTKYLLL